MEHHGQQEPPRLGQALPAPKDLGQAVPAPRTKDPRYHVFKHVQGDTYSLVTAKNPVKAVNVEYAVKQAAGPVGEEPEEFFVTLHDQLKRAKRRPATTEVFD